MFETELAICAPNLKFLASPISKNGVGAVKWLDARGGVPKLMRVSPSFFNRLPPNLATI